MRLRRLDLERFGQFSDKKIDFGELRQTSDFHIILGANEAGKTTTMEGFLRLLFGFLPVKEPYAFRHQRKNLKVSGVLELDGKEKTFVRLPGKHNNLLDENGAAVSETEISAHLGELDIVNYRKLLCLDDDTIKKGSEEITNAEGDIGRILFSAAAGVADLTAVLANEQDEADKLYRKRARGTDKIGKLRKERDSLQEKVGEIDVTIGTWRDLRDAALAAEEGELEARRERDVLLERRREAEARLGAKPNLDEHDRLSAQSAEFADYPERLDIGSTDLVDLIKKHGKAESDRSRLTDEIGLAEKELEGIDLSQEGIALAGVIEELKDLHRRAKAASRNIPKLMDDLKKTEWEIARVAGDLGAPDSADFSLLAAPTAMIVTLEKSWKALQDAERDCESAAREVLDLRDRVVSAKDDVAKQAYPATITSATVEVEKSPAGSSMAPEELSLLPDEPVSEISREVSRGADVDIQTADESELILSQDGLGSETGQEAAVVAATAGESAGELLARYDADTLVVAEVEARAAVKESKKRFDEALGDLGFADQELPDCPIAISDAEELKQRHGRIDAEISGVRRDSAAHHEEAAAAEVRIDRLKADMGMEDDYDIGKVRAERDAIWQKYRAAPNESDAVEFETAVIRSDQIADSRFEHATELGQLREMEQVRDEAKARGRSKDKQLATLKKELDKINLQVAKIAEALGISITDPAALISWVKLHEQAAKANREMFSVRADNKALLEKAERLLNELRPLISLESPNLEEAVAAARELARAEQERQRNLETAKNGLAKIEADLTRWESRLGGFKEVQEAASSQWDKLVEETFGGALGADTLGGSLSLLHSLREHDGERRRTELEISSMENDQRVFAEEVGKLAAKHGIANDDALAAFDELNAIAKRVVADQDSRIRLNETLEDCRRKLRKTQKVLHGIDRQRKQWSAFFPKSTKTDTLEELHSAINQAQDVIGWRERIAQLEAQILAALSASNLDDARARLEDASEAAIKAEIDGIKSDLKLADERHSCAANSSGAAKQALAAVSGDAEAAKLEERRTTVEIEIQETASEYLERRYGLLLASEAIRRYRDRHRTKMMTAAQQAFVELTEGAYQGLKTERDGMSEVLLTVSSDGSFKGVDELSKGARFQLYFALRAAAYKEMVARNLQLPFFCDDVFETFDDTRTRAACKLMEQIGKSGQAIYMTHHRHVVAIAEEVCNSTPIIHEL